MSYTRYSPLEKAILLGLKARHEESIANGSKPAVPVAGTAEELWSAVDRAYYYWDSILDSDRGWAELVRERILDVVGCTETEMRVALGTLLTEELIIRNVLKHPGNTPSTKLKDTPMEGLIYNITGRGLRACRQIESEF